MIECSAFLAAMKRKITADSAVLPGEEGRGFSQDLALFGERAHLAAQPAQLLTLIRGQALGLTLVDVEPARLVPERLPRAPQLLRQPRHRATARPQQTDCLTTKTTPDTAGWMA